MGYAFRVLLGLDYFLNALLGGSPQETVSARAARQADRFGWCWLYRFLVWIDPDHFDSETR